MFKLMRQVLFFLGVGSFGTACDFLFFLFLISIGCFPIVSHVMGAFLGLGVNFMLNKRYTFQDQSTVSVNDIYKVLGVGIGGLILSSVLFYVIDIYVEPVYAKIMVVVLMVVYNFVLFKWFIFDEPSE